MKFFLIILFLSITFFLKAQIKETRSDIEELFYPEFSITNLDKPISDDEKRELLIKICLLENHCDFCLGDSVNFEDTFIEYCIQHEKNIHFLDLDNDGDYDIIFNGKECEGMDEGLVEIYENKGDSINRKFKSQGKLVYFNFDSLTFMIYDYPCCAQQSHYLIEYKFDSINFSFSAQKAHLLIGNTPQMLGGPFRPNRINKHDPYMAESVVDLRWSPNTIDKDATKTCNNSNTNIICSYPAGATGTILFSASNDWFFVKMNSYSGVQNACEDNFIPVLNSIPIFYYGWIKK